MRPRPNYGDASNPLRPSRLSTLWQCLYRATVEADGMRGDDSRAADTGSVVHAAVARFHAGAAVEEALAAMKGDLATFPLADIDDAALSFRPYAADPRNSSAKVVASELKIRVELDPKYTAGPPIVIEGTLDQLREEGGTLSVWDLKTGKGSAVEMLHGYALQIASYTLGAAAAYPGRRVAAGGIIRSYGYRTRGASLPSPDGVFLESPFSLEDCDALLDGARLAVCAIREGLVTPTPGPHCNYCPLGGIDLCLSHSRRAAQTRDRS